MDGGEESGENSLDLLSLVTLWTTCLACDEHSSVHARCAIRVRCAAPLLQTRHGCPWDTAFPQLATRESRLFSYTPSPLSLNFRRGTGDAIIDIVPVELLTGIFCFVQCADYPGLCCTTNLDSVRQVCSLWKRAVEQHVARVGCVLLAQPNVSNSFVNQSFLPAFVPRRYANLISVWTELEYHLQQLHLLSIMVDVNLLPSEHHVELSVPVTSFDSTLRDWIVLTATLILEHAPKSVWKLRINKKRVELRMRIYTELCRAMGVPPDPHILKPLPPKNWSPETTFIVVSSDGVGRVNVISLDMNETREVEVLPTMKFYESRCFDVWGSRGVWTHENPRHFDGNCIDVWYNLKKSLDHGFLAPPDCAQVAHLFVSV